MNVFRTSSKSVDMVVGSVACVLFVVSLLIHVLTFWSFNIQERFPAVWLLHIAIFVLAVPLFLKNWLDERRKETELVTLNSPAPELPEPDPKTIAEGIGLSRWLTAIYLALGFYVMVNFVVFVIGAEGTPDRVGEMFVLKYRTTVIREITREEYDIASAHLLHGFSGHWLIFYFYFASAGMYAASKK